MPSLKKSKPPSYTPPKEVNRTSDQSFYNSTTWRKYSLNYRAMNPLCEVSIAADDPIGSQLVDHIVPIEQGGSWYDPCNHMAMCHYWHNKKRGLESQGYVVDHINGINGFVPINREDITNKLLSLGGYVQK